MWSARHFLRQKDCNLRNVLLRSSCTSPSTTHWSDTYGIPLRPSWSVNELLSSYPSPTLSSATLKRLYELSALIPPEEGTPEHDKVKRELQDLIKLVEAVKMVKTDSVHLMGCKNKEDADVHDVSGQAFNIREESSGRGLLKHAARTLDGFYVVDTDRRR